MTVRWKKPVVWSLCFFALPAGFLIASLVQEDQTVSKEERRTLARFPGLSVDSLLDGEFQEGFERYAADHLAGRSSLLKLRAYLSYYGYGHLDDNGLIARNGSIIQTGKELNVESIEHAADVFARIDETCMQNTDCRVYFAIVPDKAYFVQDDPLIALDYDLFFEQAAAAMDFASQIDLTDALSLEDYYSTDPHWKQENILPAAQKLAEAMKVEIEPDWNLKTALEEFEGQQGVQTILSHRSDSLNYLENDQMKDWTVLRYDLGKPETSVVYDQTKADSLDPYSLFLGGSTGMITIENPQGQTDRDLIIFSDSFGFSITPLLASGYETTTLIDLRNLPSWRLNQVVDFDDQDVLFLYSAGVLNASSQIK